MARAAAAAGGAADADGTSAPAAAVRGTRGAPGTWRRVRRVAQEVSAHALLLCFTTLLSLKLDGVFSRSWMRGALMPGYGETITDEDVWESLPVMQLLWGGGIYSFTSGLPSALLFLSA